MTVAFPEPTKACVQTDLAKDLTCEDLTEEGIEEHEIAFAM